MKGQLKPSVHPSPMGSEDTSSSWVYPTLPLSAQLFSSAQSLTVWEGDPLLPDQAHRILCAKFSSPGLPKHLMHMQKLCDHGSTGPGYQAQEGPGAKLTPGPQGPFSGRTSSPLSKRCSHPSTCCCQDTWANTRAQQSVLQDLHRP